MGGICFQEVRKTDTSNSKQTVRKVNSYYVTVFNLQKLDTKHPKNSTFLNFTFTLEHQRLEFKA